MMREKNWFSSDAGQALVSTAIAHVAPLVWPLCGHQAMLFQPCTQGMGKPVVQCASVWQVQRANQQFYGDFIAYDAQLPVATDCIALIYSAFVLETSVCAEQLLAEWERILVAEGYLALLVLNPYSPSRLTRRWKDLQLKSYSQWLRLLQHAGFEVTQQQALGPVWARAQTVPAGTFFHRPNGLRSVHFILAKKRKSALTPIRTPNASVALARDMMHDA